MFFQLIPYLFPSIREQAAQRNALDKAQKVDLHAQRQRELYDKVGDQLSEAMMEPDESVRNAAVDSVLNGVEQLQQKPVSKQFRSWLTSNPQDAAQVLANMKDRGVSPEILFKVQDNPLLFAQGLLALGKAKRERGIRDLRSEGTGEGPATGDTSAPSESPQGLQYTTPQGQQIRGEEGLGATFPTPGAPAPQVAAAPVQDNSPQGVLDQQKGVLQQRINALQTRINGLAGLGADEKNIAPLRQEKQTLEAELRNITTQAPLAATKERAVSEEQVVSREELQAGTEAALRAGRGDLAVRFRPGMRRQAYEKVMDQVSGDTNTLIPTKPEEIRTQARIQRREQALPEDLARDPNLAGTGITTRGQFEDFLGNGRRIQTAPEKARSETLATGGATQTLKDFSTIKDEGVHARRLSSYYDILAGAAQKAGVRGPWLTPMRERANNLANLLGISNPSGQSNLQLMEAFSNKLIPELTQQFKGSQSDREFLAGLASAPSVRNTEQGFAVLLNASREMNKIAIERDIQARRWVQKYGALDAPNPQGQAFEAAFADALTQYEKANGTLQQRIEKSMKVKPGELLKRR